MHSFVAAWIDAVAHWNTMWYVYWINHPYLYLLAGVFALGLTIARVIISRRRRL